eukprot:TRINITY_DN50529_c0_g3_i1.p2 TRINITY_DN50529_c0_g3~~TRINITY_DN50529_c0_g3_i1.p2  ORF type:complete len:109 (-),score=35.57 TRINITY_DN50529_c0_g3_i1:22-303(-)
MNHGRKHKVRLAKPERMALLYLSRCVKKFGRYSVRVRALESDVHMTRNNIRMGINYLQQRGIIVGHGDDIELATRLTGLGKARDTLRTMLNLK